MAWNLGANDAASPCSIPVGTGVISVKRATLLFSVFAAIGAISQGHMNITTISQGIVPRIDPLGAITISLAACVWSGVCTWRGLEISNTYTVVGSVIGYALVVYGSFQSTVLINVLESWVVSPVCAITLSYALNKLLYKLCGTLLNDIRVLRAISLSLLASLCFSAYCFGANDVGSATGVYVAVTQDVAGLPDYTAMLILAAFGAVGIAVGGLTWGHRVIETVAFKIVRIDTLSGLAAEIANALVVFLFVTIPHLYLGYGLPVSTSIVGVGAIVGATLARGEGMIDKRTIGRLAVTWIFTIPITAFISAVLYSILSR